MDEPRLAPAPRPYAPELEQALARLMPPGVEPLRLFRTLAHNERVLSRFLAGGLLDKGSISLRERCDDVSPTVLNQRLAELRESGLIAHEPGSGYALTALGESLGRALGPLGDWAGRWASQLARAR